MNSLFLSFLDVERKNNNIVQKHFVIHLGTLIFSIHPKCVSLKGTSDNLIEREWGVLDYKERCNSILGRKLIIIVLGLITGYGVKLGNKNSQN